MIISKYIYMHYFLKFYQNITDFFSKFFKEWLVNTGQDANFEEMSKETLASTLHLFYPSACQKPKNYQEQEDFYQKQTLVNICSAINRHKQMPPYNCTWDLMKDSKFKAPNRSFSGNLRKQKDEGHDMS